MTPYSTFSKKHYSREEYPHYPSTFGSSYTSFSYRQKMLRALRVLEFQVVLDLFGDGSYAATTKDLVQDSQQELARPDVREKHRLDRWRGWYSEEQQYKLERVYRCDSVGVTWLTGYQQKFIEKTKLSAQQIDWLYLLYREPSSYDLFSSSDRVLLSKNCVEALSPVRSIVAKLLFFIMVASARFKVFEPTNRFEDDPYKNPYYTWTGELKDDFPSLLKGLEGLLPAYLGFSESAAVTDNLLKYVDYVSFLMSRWCPDSYIPDAPPMKIPYRASQIKDRYLDELRLMPYDYIAQVFPKIAGRQKRSEIRDGYLATVTLAQNVIDFTILKARILHRHHVFKVFFAALAVASVFQGLFTYGVLPVAVLGVFAPALPAMVFALPVAAMVVYGILRGLHYKLFVGRQVRQLEERFSVQPGNKRPASQLVTIDAALDGLTGLLSSLESENTVTQVESPLEIPALQSDSETEAGNTFAPLNTTPICDVKGAIKKVFTDPMGWQPHFFNARAITSEWESEDIRPDPYLIV